MIFTKDLKIDTCLRLSLPNYSIKLFFFSRAPSSTDIYETSLGVLSPPIQHKKISFTMILLIWNLEFKVWFLDCLFYKVFALQNQ